MDFEITDAAVSKLKEMLEKEDTPGGGLRIQVVPGGCSGFVYNMGFVAEAHSEDSVIEKGGIKVFLDPNSREMLANAKLDYVESLQGAGFKIDNPNAQSSCGCGKSFC